MKQGFTNLTVRFYLMMPRAAIKQKLFSSAIKYFIIYMSFLQFVISAYCLMTFSANLSIQYNVIKTNKMHVHAKTKIKQ